MVQFIWVLQLGEDASTFKTPTTTFYGPSSRIVGCNPASNLLWPTVLFGSLVCFGICSRLKFLYRIIRWLFYKLYFINYFLSKLFSVFHFM